MSVRPRRRIFSRVLLLLLLSLVVVAAFWFGLVPQRLSPFPPISLDERPSWFVDPRLAALRRDPVLCRAVVRSPHAEATPLADNPLKGGCGWVNAVRLSTAGGARVGAEPLTCEMAAAFALWMTHEVQPTALAMLGSKVASVRDMGSYSCRNIIGNPLWKDARSQHATANAFDVGGFTLENGRSISVRRDWQGRDVEARFLREIHARSCRYFRVSLGPDFNPAHRDHFHFDRGYLWSCR